MVHYIYIPEDCEICPKCKGHMGFYYKNNVDINGKNCTDECFGCLQCKGIVKINS